MVGVNIRSRVYNGLCVLLQVNLLECISDCSSYQPDNLSVCVSGCKSACVSVCVCVCLCLSVSVCLCVYPEKDL